MTTTYFLQKIRKYALPLLVLQSVIIIGLVAYFNFQSVECQKQKEDLTQIIAHYQKPFGEFLNTRKQTTEMGMTRQAWEMDLGQEYVDCASEINDYTEKLQKEIDQLIASKTLENNDLSFENTIEDHKEFILQSITKLNLELRQYSKIDEADLTSIEEIYANPLVNDSQVLWKQYQRLKTSESYLAYLTKLKNDLQFAADKVITFLWLKMPSQSCRFGQYHVEVNAPNFIGQGDTLNATIFLAEVIPVKGKLMIGEEAIAEGRLEGETYQVKADKLGKHQIKGALITKDGYGNTKTYSFVHEYTVLPKSE